MNRLRNAYLELEPELDDPQPAARAATKPQSLEDIRREARENWLRLRESQSQDHADSARSDTNDRLQNDDLAR